MACLGDPPDWLRILGSLGVLMLLNRDLEYWQQQPLLSSPDLPKTSSTAANLLAALTKVKQVPWIAFCDLVAERNWRIAEDLRQRLGLTKGNLFRVQLELDPSEDHVKVWADLRTQREALSDHLLSEGNPVRVLSIQLASNFLLVYLVSPVNIATLDTPQLWANVFSQFDVRVKYVAAEDARTEPPLTPWPAGQGWMCSYNFQTRSGSVVSFT